MNNINSFAKQKLLTIAIPTFNRDSYLELCLSRIIKEIESLSVDQRSLVEVFVSDNASTDRTPEIIEKFKLIDLEVIKFVRNNVNIGADRNIAGCYESAVSSYVWIFGDDDVMLPGALQKVVDVLLNREVDILYVNNYWFKNSYTENIINAKKQGVFEFDEPFKFARRTNVMLTFISGIIVRSGIGKEFRKELLASNLVQLSWVFPLLCEGKCFVVIEDWVVAAKGSNSGGYELVKVFAKNLQKISVDLLKKKPDLIKSIENGVIVNFFPDFILEFRKGTDKFLDKSMASGLHEVFHSNWRYHFFLVPLISFPIQIANTYNLFLKVLRRIFRCALI